MPPDNMEEDHTSEYGRDSSSAYVATNSRIAATWRHSVVPLSIAY
jgi:hypothetical protein